MYHANAYVIRRATQADAAALRILAELDSQSVPTGDVLLGEIDGTPAVAMSLTSGRVVADPFRPTATLTAHMRARVDGLRAAAAEPSLRRRIRAGIHVHPASAG